MIKQILATMILILCMLLSSCGEKVSVYQNNCLVINLDSAENKQKEYFSSMFDDAGIIVLEDTERSLLTRIDKIEFLDNYLYALEKQGGLFMFTSDGTFVKRIGGKGVGPGEYLSPTDITIDAKNKKIFLLDAQNQVVLKYNADGTYDGSFKLENKNTTSRFIQFFDRRLYTDLCGLDQSQENYLLSEVDINNGNRKSLHLNTLRYNKGWNELLTTNQRSFVSQSAGKPKFMQLFMDTIFEIDKEGLKPYIAIQSKDLITKEFLDIQKENRSASEAFTELNKANKIYDLNNYLESDSFIYFNYFINKYTRSVLYKKTDHSTAVVQTIINDLLYADYTGMQLLPKFVHFDRKRAYTIEMNSDFSRSLFISKIKENKINSRINGIDKLKALTEESNPVIVYYEFKHDQ